MATNSIDVSRLLNKFENLKNVDLYTPLAQSAAVVESDAKRKVPVDTGQLRGSINSEIINKENKAVIGTNVEYAPYVELGTGLFATEGNGRQTPWAYKDANDRWHYTTGQKPQPYLQPALNENESKIKKIFKEYLRGEIGKNAGR